MSFSTIVLRVVAIAAALCLPISSAFSQASGAGEIQEKDIPIQVTEVAPGLYFQYHHQESNNAFLVTPDGVLVIDTRQHPKRAEELVVTIRNAGGPFSKNSWPNPSFTPSMQGWIGVLNKIAAMDVDKYLGGHGDIGTKEDVLAEARMLTDFDAGMRAAVAKGMTVDEIIKNVRFEKYKDVRNYYRMNLFISSYYHSLTTGKPQNAYP
jgi:hypothetical protein